MNLKCKGCDEEKPITSFYKDRNKVNGVKNMFCKQCNQNFKKQKYETKSYDDMTTEMLAGMFEDTEYDKTVNKQTCHSAIFIGSSKSGKSTLIKHLMFQLYQRYDLIVVFSQSLHDPMYDYITTNTNGKFIAFDKFNASIINDIMLINKKLKNALQTLILFDDMIGMNIKDVNEIIQLFVRGRNSGISTFFSSQSVTFLNRTARSNANYVFILKNNNPSMRETIINNFLYNVVPVPNAITNKVKKVEYYDKMLSELNADYGVIVLDFLQDPVKMYHYKVPM